MGGELKRGVLRAFDAGTDLATVQLEGSPGYLGGVPVSRGIAAAAMVSGRVVAVLFFDEAHERDAMILGVY